ncbi:MAG: Mov34/MPN/PAD-1 family protein [Polymorphobacter sp.]
MIIAIASGVADALVSAAADADPNEACGLLLGTPGRIMAAVPARNVAAHPERSFEIDPATLLRTHREARGQGQAVIGHYHSHPNGNAEPSLRDAARAVNDGQIWVIIANGTAHAWQVVADDPGGSAVHGCFLPVTLVAG